MDNQEWTKKINRARYVERQILRWVKKNFDNEAVLVDGYSPERDIISKVLGDVEVKEDRMAHQSQKYAFEYKDSNGKDSGYAVTKAKFFVLVDWEYVIYMATESLKFIINSCTSKQVVFMGAVNRLNGKQAEGWLIPRDVILNSPLVTVQKRWFLVLLENNVRTK